MLCLPLDMDDYDKIKQTIDELWDLVGWWKLNFAFTNYGPEIVEYIKKKGGKVFLDLKFHDIPNTVAGYARAAQFLSRLLLPGPSHRLDERPYRVDAPD